MRFSVAAGIAIVALGGALGAQSFEVSSVKRSPPEERGYALQFQKGGRFVATNATLQDLLLLALHEGPVGLPPQQLVGGPAWLATTHFDIVAKAPSEIPPGNIMATPEGTALVRSLIVERFKLQTHKETRTLPVYVLLRSKADGTLGPALIPHNLDCDAIRQARSENPSAVPFAPLIPGKAVECGMTMMTGAAASRFTGSAQAAGVIASVLRNPTGSLVLDRTGLPDRYDFDLQFRPEPTMSGQFAPKTGSVPESNLPSIYTAVQEQLGLKLESRREPVEVTVIDHIEIPTED